MMLFDHLVPVPLRQPKSFLFTVLNPFLLRLVGHSTFSYSAYTMAAARALRRLTEAEYLEIERAAETKSEFFDGEMFAIAGGTYEHSLIGTNLAREFGNKLKSGPCVASNADLKVKIEATGLYTYPALSVVCGQPRFVEGTRDTIINPTLVAEVLSDSTEAYDRGTKFVHYRQIPSLKVYLLVSQKEPRMDQYIRQPDGSWLLTEAVGLKASLKIPPLRISILLKEVFANVKFPSASIRGRATGDRVQGPGGGR
jgi:Uma2 family endonuclease